MHILNRLIAVGVLVCVCETTESLGDVVLFSEDFESYSDGALAGQGGWTGDAEIRLTSSGNALGTRVVDGFDVPAAEDQIRRVRHAIDLSSAGPILVLSFDTFATSVDPESHGSSLGFDNVAWFPVADTSVAAPVPYMSFDARAITGNPSDVFDVAVGNGFDAKAELEIVVNFETAEVFGRYDFGAGNTGQTTTYTALATQLAAIDEIVLRQDFRFVPAGPSATDFVGSEYDNIQLVSVPEAGTTLALGFVSLTLLAKNRRGWPRLR